MTKLELRLSLELAKAKVDKIRYETYVLYFLLILANMIYTKIPFTESLFLRLTITFALSLIVFVVRLKIEAKKINEVLFACPECGELIPVYDTETVISRSKCSICHKLIAE